MSTSVDDLDDLLRAAMKSLDDQVPSGYLEALPEQVLARLEGTMQSSGQPDGERATASPPPKQRDEDSGLHDIRNLAQTTKQRLSHKRVAGPMRPSADDLLASTSAGWKAVALPEPAKMVSLPSLEELPTKAEIRAQDKAAAKAAAAAPAAPAAKPAAAEAKPVAAAAVEAPVVVKAAVVAKAPVARPAAPKKSSRGLITGVSVAVAAAAGALLFVKMRPDQHAAQPAPELQAQQPVQAPAPGPARAQITATPIAPPVADVPAAEPPPPPPVATGAAEPEPHHAAPKAKHVERGLGKAADTASPSPPDKTAEKPGKDHTKDASGKEQDPSFDDLLKQAGVDQNKKPVKPKLANKELTSDDFKRGMSAIEGNAKNCFKGTQGLANLEIKVSPSGQVSGVVVSGLFKGKPEASCVTNAVRSAQFPPWDGGQQSFTYPILLSE
jgi:hypothetical protein